MVSVELNDPINIIKVMPSWSVYLTTLFPDRLRPKEVNHYKCMFFYQKWQLPRKYFVLNHHERMLPDPVGVHPATSSSPARCALGRARDLHDWKIKIIFFWEHNMVCNGSFSQGHPSAKIVRMAWPQLVGLEFNSQSTSLISCRASQLTLEWVTCTLCTFFCQKLTNAPL